MQAVERVVIRGVVVRVLHPKARCLCGSNLDSLSRPQVADPALSDPRGELG